MEAKKEVIVLLNHDAPSPSPNSKNSPSNHQKRKEKNILMAWYDTAPVAPPESVRYLGEVLEEQRTPLREMVLEKPQRDYRAYSADTPIGRVGVAVGFTESNVFFSPHGTRRFINLWDWKECVLGEPRPKGMPSVEESVEWVLGLLALEELPEIDLERVEKSGQDLDRRVARDRWLTPLYTVFWFSLVIGVIVVSAMLESTAGVVIGGLALTRMIITTLTSLGVKLWRPKKKS